MGRQKGRRRKEWRGRRRGRTEGGKEGKKNYSEKTKRQCYTKKIQRDKIDINREIVKAESKGDSEWNFSLLWVNSLG